MGAAAAATITSGLIWTEMRSVQEPIEDRVRICIQEKQCADVTRQQYEELKDGFALKLQEDQTFTTTEWNTLVAVLNMEIKDKVVFENVRTREDLKKRLIEVLNE